FLCPLLIVFLGRALLGECLDGWQRTAVAFAALGVALLCLKARTFPTYGLFLASSFALYAVVRKRMPLPPLLASTLEAILLVPFALAYLLFSAVSDSLVAATPREWALLVGGGVLT